MRAAGTFDSQRTVVKALLEAAQDEDMRINAEQATRMHIPSPLLRICRLLNVSFLQIPLLTAVVFAFLDKWIGWNEAYLTWRSAVNPAPGAVSINDGKPS